MQLFSTRNLPAREKLGFWVDISCRNFSSMEVTPENGMEFDGTLYTQQAGVLSVSLLESSAVSVHRARRHISRSGDQRFILNCPLNGSFKLSQCGYELCIREGDLVLMDNAVPYDLEHGDFCRTMIVSMPRDLLRRYFPSPERFLGLRVPAAPGLSNIASAMLRNLGLEMKRGTLSGNNTELERGVMEFIALAFNDSCRLAPSDTTARLSRRMEIRRYIEEYLHDPELTPGSIAHAMNMSGRYLRMLFRQEGETVSAYILRRRLEECARQLASPVWCRSTISEIAFSRGFNNLTWFGQAFKKRYGVTPGDYRRYASAREEVVSGPRFPLS